MGQTLTKLKTNSVMVSEIGTKCQSYENKYKIDEKVNGIDGQFCATKRLWTTSILLKVILLWT